MHINIYVYIIYINIYIRCEHRGDYSVSKYGSEFNFSLRINSDKVVAMT